MAEYFEALDHEIDYSDAPEVVPTSTSQMPFSPNDYDTFLASRRPSEYVQEDPTTPSSNDDLNTESGEDGDTLRPSNTRTSLSKHWSAARSAISRRVGPL
jgi:hypothetical protein